VTVKSDGIVADAPLVPLPVEVLAVEPEVVVEPLSAVGAALASSLLVSAR